MTQKIQIIAGQDQHLGALYRPCDDKNLPDRSELLIVMVHGFPGHKASNNDLYGDLEFLLADKGYHMLRFDFRGCGESDGKQEQFSIASAGEDFINVMQWAKGKDYKRFIFIGEGLGGTISLMNLGLNTQALVLLWPVLNVKDYYEQNFRNRELDADGKARGYIDHEGNKYGLEFLLEMKKTSMNEKLRDAFMPTLILHGALDNKIPVSQLDMARDHMNARRLEITTFHDGEHGLQKLNHRKMMFYHILQFVEKYT